MQKIIMATNQHGSNQYEKRPKYRKTIIALFIIIVGLGLYQWYTGPERVSESATKEIVAKSDDLTPEQRAALKRQAELAERELILKNKKAKLDSEYKASSDAIETELESIRSEKLSFK